MLILLILIIFGVYNLDKIKYWFKINVKLVFVSLDGKFSIYVCWKVDG